MAEWYTKEGKDNDVVLSTKACIVRNIKGYNFMPRLDDKECQSLIETIDGAVDKDIFIGGSAASMDKETAMRLIRLQVLGREGSQMAAPQRKAFYYNDDCSLNIAVSILLPELWLRAMTSVSISRPRNLLWILRANWILRIQTITAS